MTEAGSINEMFGNINSLEGGDIEAGRNTGHAADKEKIIQVDPLSEKTEYGVINCGDNAEVERWAGSLTRILEDVPQYMWTPGHPGRISRIPENLRELDVKAYEPHFMSIGPYHHGKPKLRQMEKRKKIVLKYFLEKKHELTLTNCLAEIKSIEPVVRSFYSDVQMDSEQFVQMLLFDGFYLVILFCGMARNQEWMNQTNTRREADDMGTSNYNDNMNIVAGADEPSAEMWRGENNAEQPGWFWSLFVHDLFLLENQLPFFLLQKIYVLAYGGSETELIGIMKAIIGSMLPDYVNVNPEVILPTGEFHHLLHLCHLFFRPTVQQEHITLEHSESSQMFRLGSALQLYEAGVRFETRLDSTQHSLVDITFNRSGKMVMPCLQVDDNTDSLLRNLIALEQMKYPCLGLDISAYVVLLLHLITTPADAKLLRRKGIIMHHLASDKDMMYLINRLSVGLSFDYVGDNYSLKPVLHELRRYTERRVPRWRAWLKHRYFNNPWTVISLLAASLLLLLSAVQTYYTVYSYYRHA